MVSKVKVSEVKTVTMDTRQHKKNDTVVETTKRNVITRPDYPKYTPVYHTQGENNTYITHDLECHDR